MLDKPRRWYLFSFFMLATTIGLTVGLGVISYSGIQQTTLKLRTPPSDTLIGRTVDLCLRYYNGQVSRHPLYWGITARNGSRDVDTPLAKQFFDAAVTALGESEFGPFISDIQSIFNIPRSGDKFVIGDFNDSTMLIKIDNNMSVAHHNQKHLVLWMENFASSFVPESPADALEWRRRFRAFATGVGSMTLDLTAEVWLCMVVLAGISLLLSAFIGPLLLTTQRQFTGTSTASVVARSAMFVTLAWVSPLACGFSTLDGIARMHSTSSFAPMMIFLVAGPLLLFFCLQSLRDAVAVSAREPDHLAERDHLRRQSVASQPASRTTSQLQRTLNSFGLAVQQSLTPRLSPRVTGGQSPIEKVDTGDRGRDGGSQLGLGNSPGPLADFLSVPLLLSFSHSEGSRLHLLPFSLLGVVGAAVVNAECIGTAGTATLAAVTVCYLSGAVLRPLLLVTFFPAGLSNVSCPSAETNSQLRGPASASAGNRMVRNSSSGEDVGALHEHRAADGHAAVNAMPKKSPRQMADERQALLSSSDAHHQQQAEDAELNEAPLARPSSGLAKAIFAALLLGGLTAACGALCANARGDVGFFNQVPRDTVRVEDGHLLLDAVTAAASGPFYFVFMPAAGPGGVLNETFWEAVASDAGFIVERTNMPLANLSSVTYADGINISFPQLAELLLGLGNITAYPYLFNSMVDPTRTLLQVAVYPTFNPFTEKAAAFQDTLDAICDEMFQRRREVYAFVGWYGANAGNWAMMHVVVPQWKLGTALGLAGAVALLFSVLFVMSRNSGAASCLPWQSAIVAVAHVLLCCSSTLLGIAVIVAIFQFHEEIRLVENLPRVAPEFLNDVSGVTWMVFPFAQPILTAFLLVLHAHAAIRRMGDLRSSSDDAHLYESEVADIRPKYPIGPLQMPLPACLCAFCPAKCKTITLSVEQYLLFVMGVASFPFVLSNTTMLNEIGLLLAVGFFFDAAVAHPAAAHVHLSVLHRA
jgi:hypothetical protein